MGSPFNCKYQGPMSGGGDWDRGMVGDIKVHGRVIRV